MAKRSSPKPATKRWFTPAEDCALLNHNGAIAEVARQLGRSESSCRYRLAKLTYDESEYRHFTPEEDELIRGGQISVSGLAEQLGRRPGTITHRFKRLGAVCENPRRRIFSAEEDALILANPFKTHSELARMLNRDRSAVRKRRKTLVGG